MTRSRSAGFGTELRKPERLWGVVLAAGEGRRLASLTGALYGRELPKQFAVLDGDRSLLQTTLARIAPLIPLGRIVVVVGREQERLARSQLRPFPGVHLVIQPRNLDTGPGILLPLAWILSRDPRCRVALFPSDHYVKNPGPFLEAVTRAAEASLAADRLTLLGVVPDGPETEYGWILPGPPLAEEGDPAVRSVRRFVEKPPPGIARRLLHERGLWNTLVSVGRLAAFWRLARTYLPEHTAAFLEFSRSVGTPREASRLEEIYRRLPSANFSRALLERAGRLAVMSVAGSGWSDWGSPSRVFQSLAGTTRLEILRGRMAPHPLAPPAVRAAS